MFPHLHIYDRRERTLVGLADALLGIAAWLPRRFAPVRPSPIRRILVLRLERIGDLVMTLDALTATRALAPDARIDLVVGSWNAEIAGAIGTVDHVETLDLPWIARDGTGESWAALLARARAWRARRYDAAINFEPDIRSNLLLALSAAPIRAGFSSGGGGAFLNETATYDASAHTSDNARMLVARLFGVPELPSTRQALQVPDAARHRVDGLLEGAGGDRRRPLLAVHASGGRPIKQWPPERFGLAIAAVAERLDAIIVATGAAGDRALVDRMRAAIPGGQTVVDLTGQLSLIELSALLERVTLLLTGDTGPMHLAAAVGADVVAVFGPSDPARYAPLATRHRVVRVDLPCSPCNRIRLPPERCRGVVPDCLALVDVDRVVGECLALVAAADIGPRRSLSGVEP